MCVSRLQPPPSFLSLPGQPVIPWEQWKQAIKNYMIASVPPTYLPFIGRGADREPPADAYKAALADLDKLFDSPQDPVCVRAYFKSLRQRPDESAVQFILEVRRMAKLCDFGTVSDVLAFDQIVSGITSPHLQRTFFKMGKDFTVKKALDVACEEERVDHVLQHFSSL
ncbi:hypothetical protein MTO96_018245 [Rhipicephalus appendiculatus]